MQNLNEIEELIKIISKLPGLGPKSAKRIILKLISNRDELLKPMAKVLVDIYKNVSRCNICGTLKSKNECQNCKSSNNKRKIKRHKINAITSSNDDTFVELVLKNPIASTVDQLFFDYRDPKGNQRNGIVEDLQGNDLPTTKGILVEI